MQAARVQTSKRGCQKCYQPLLMYVARPSSFMMASNSDVSKCADCSSLDHGPVLAWPYNLYDIVWVCFLIRLLALTARRLLIQGLLLCLSVACWFWPTTHTRDVMQRIGFGVLWTLFMSLLKWGVRHGFMDSESFFNKLSFIKISENSICSVTQLERLNLLN